MAVCPFGRVRCAGSGEGGSGGGQLHRIEGTRSARDPGPDDTVLNGVVLEFDAAGTLLEMQPFSEGYMPVLKVRKHQELNIYVVANPTVDFRSVSTLEEFLSMQSQYKSNSQGRLEMLGHFQGSFTGLQDTG